MTSRSYSLLAAITVLLSVCIVGGLVSVKILRDRRFHSIQASLFSRGHSAIQLDGKWGDATVRAGGDAPLTDIDLIETCGPIRRLQLDPQPPVSPQAISRLLSLPGLKDIWVLIGDPLSDDTIASMCRQGHQIRELNLHARSISGQALLQFGDLPALEGFKLDHTIVTGGTVSLVAGFPALKKLDLDFQRLKIPTSKVEIAHLSRLEEIYIDEPSSHDGSREKPGPEVTIAGLANLDTLTILISTFFDHPSIKISDCPRLRRIALCQRTCDSHLLEEIASTSSELRELVIKASDELGPAEAVALSKFKHLESLELHEAWLKPSLLAAIAELPNLSRLTLEECELVPDGVDFDQGVHSDISESDVDESPADAVQVTLQNWSVLARCRHLKELVFWSKLKTPDGLVWIKDLNTLTKLDLTKAFLDVDQFVDWEPASASPDIDDAEKDSIGTEMLVEHLLDTCAQMPSLTELLVDEDQIKRIAPAHRPGKFRITEGIDRNTFGWRPFFATDPSM